MEVALFQSKAMAVNDILHFYTEKARIKPQYLHECLNKHI